MPASYDELKPYKRHLLIYELLKRRGPMSITEVYDALRSRGYKVTRKTVERDLKERMANDESFGLSSTEGERPERFFITEGHELSHLIPLTSENIQVLALALNSLRKVAAKEFERYVDDLELAVRKRIPKDLERVLFVSEEQHIIQYGLSGRSRTLPVKETGAVLRALREGKSIECFYQSKNSPERRQDRRRFGPVAIELFGGAFYLLVKDLDDREAPLKRLKLSRISQVDLIDQKFTRPSKKEIAEYLHSFGGFGGAKNPAIKIRLKGDRALAMMFEDREFSPEQKVSQRADGSWEITLKMADSLPLARMLAGYGGNIYSIEPVSLRKQVMKIWQEGLARVG